MFRFLASFILVPSFALAQGPLIKCISAEGVSYQDTPCPGGVPLRFPEELNVLQRIPVPQPQPEPWVAPASFVGHAGGGYTSYTYATPYGAFTSPVPLSISTSRGGGVRINGYGYAPVHGVQGRDGYHGLYSRGGRHRR